jgi:hypothetical protein
MDNLVERRLVPMLKMDGYNDCILGTCYRFGQEPIFAYDRGKVLEKLMEDGMAYDEAEEFFEFNQLGAWVGDGTPCFIELGEGLEELLCSNPT